MDVNNPAVSSMPPTTPPPPCPPVPPALSNADISVLVNEQEIAGAVGSAALHRIGNGSSQRRRGGPGLWLSLKKRGRMHLLLCADLVRFYREEAEQTRGSDVAPAGRARRRGFDRDGNDEDNNDVAASPSGDGRGGKRKAKHGADLGAANLVRGGRAAAAAAAVGGANRAGDRGARKRCRTTDPWEDILGALNAQAPLQLAADCLVRSSSVSASGGGR